MARLVSLLRYGPRILSLLFMINLVLIELGEYEWKTYSQIHSDSEALANYLMAKDLVPKRDTEDGQIRFMALYAKNREEWVVTDFACILSGVTVVTLYDTLGKDSLEYILD